jgi:hypothetical protein
VSPGGRALWRQLGKRHPVDKALSNIRPVRLIGAGEYNQAAQLAE